MNAPSDLFKGVIPFVTAAELGSVRGAARALGVTPSAISKAVAALEERLGVRLLNRSARRVWTTTEGEAVLRCYQEAVLRGLAARDVALAAQQRPRGLLKVSASRVLGRRLPLVLPGLFARFPELSLQLSFTDRVVHLADEDVDVAIRIGALRDSEGKAWPLARTQWVTVAAPAYLARRGIPARPEDLAGHACLRFLSPRGRAQDWTFAGPDSAARAMAVNGPVVADDGEALVAAAVAGAGIVQAPDFMVAEAIAEGVLVAVLDEYAAPGPRMWAVAAPRRHNTPKVRAFVGFVREFWAS